MSHDYDILIIGGGMVGAAIAAALGDSTLRVAVVETFAPQEVDLTDIADLRASALTRASENILRRVKAWEGVIGRRASPYQRMHVWDASGNGMIHFDCEELGEPNLGHIVENRVTQCALWNRLRELKNVELLCPAAPTGIEWLDDHAVVQLEHGTALKAKLVIGADGGQSRVREWAGIGAHGWMYDHKALVATVRTERPHQDTAWQRFLPTGPLAFLPLADGSSSIVWSTHPEIADQLLELSEAEFLGELSEAFDHTLGDVTFTGPRAAFQLQLRQTANYVAHRMAVAGDAAHRIHPLAGQGVNLGLLDGASLAQVILEAHERGKDVGSLHVLRRYERWRRTENVPMLAAMDGFKRLFGSQWEPVRLLRNLGLNLTNAATPLKNHFALRGMGLAGGDLPALARPLPY
ncbi:UbiH/UbiF/VisC/COQ6 family ubiquinone biosynthesis hydroxylase [Endothiovibrio diazotrophicus]